MHGKETLLYKLMCSSYPSARVITFSIQRICEVALVVALGLWPVTHGCVCWFDISLLGPPFGDCIESCGKLSIRSRRHSFKHDLFVVVREYPLCLCFVSVHNLAIRKRIVSLVLQATKSIFKSQAIVARNENMLSANLSSIELLNVKVSGVVVWRYSVCSLHLTLKHESRPKRVWS